MTFDRGAREIRKRTAADRAWLRPGDAGYEDFASGWEAAHADRPRDDVRRNFGGNEAERRRFREGYAEGAADRHTQPH